jgi:FAD/FMN-containing dehydrogenase
VAPSLRMVLDFNKIDETVTVEAGLITQQLQAFALENDLFYPVDFASSGSSQIGGNIATNAGGIKVVRYGLTRDWVLGLKVVTGSGEVLNLNNGLIKNATGYDFRHLFIGSEGTLGFIVEATMQLTKLPKGLTTLLLSVPKMTDLIEVLRAFRQKISLSAFEFFSEAALQHVLLHDEKSHPFTEKSDYYALIEFEDSEGRALELAMLCFEGCIEQGWVCDGIVSQSEQQRQDIWHFREAISESITPHTPYKNDISVKVSKVPGFLHEVESEIIENYPDFEIVWFGHIGDGNLHLNILRPSDWSVKNFKRECENVSQKILSIVKDNEGSISAEHGVGLLKKDQLHFSRSDTEIEYMKAMKQVFDPDGIMNPGKLIPIDQQ